MCNLNTFFLMLPPEYPSNQNISNMQLCNVYKLMVSQIQKYQNACLMIFLRSDQFVQVLCSQIPKSTKNTPTIYFQFKADGLNANTSGELSPGLEGNTWGWLQLRYRASPPSCDTACLKWTDVLRLNEARTCGSIQGL